MCVTQYETAMAEKFVKLVNVMKKLREPDGCRGQGADLHVAAAAT